MDFAVGDKVVYNPNVPDLQPPKFRPREHAKIIKIDSHYLYLLFYNADNHRSKILKESITYLPYTEKWLRQCFSPVLTNIETKALSIKEQRSRRIFTEVLDELHNHRYHLNTALMYNLDGE
jgi:hypothetical protein